MNKNLGVFLALAALILCLELSSLSLANDAVRRVGCTYEVSPNSLPNRGFLFVDHSRMGRSGHLGHALVEYQDGKILAFYPNCSDDNGGHSAVGWMEYKRSEDGGESWSEPSVLAYSKNLLDSGQAGEPSTRKLSAFAEKAVLTDKGEIVLFFLVCDISTQTVWSHFQTPTYLISADGGTRGASRRSSVASRAGSTMLGITTARSSLFTLRTGTRSVSSATRRNRCMSCTLAATAAGPLRNAASFRSTLPEDRTGPWAGSLPEASSSTSTTGTTSRRSTS